MFKLKHKNGIHGLAIHKIAGYDNEAEVTIVDGFNYKVTSRRYDANEKSGTLSSSS